MPLRYHEPMNEIETLKRRAPRAFEGEPVAFAYLFGSRARGAASVDSDVDVAVYLEAGASPKEHVSISLRLAGRLADATGLPRIEVLPLNDAPLTLAGRVLRERVVIYSRDEPARVRYESLVFREFLDFEFHARDLDRELLRRTAEGRR